jgi:FkbM family methyltransferase
MCSEFLTADDSVVEIGSAIGFIGLFCQKNLGIRNYVLFEANPATLKILRANYALNGLAPAASNVALGPRDGLLELEVESDFWENSILPNNRDGSGKTVSVPGASFGSLVERVGRPFNVLIIDVEGAEQFIDPDEIPASVNKIIIELHPDRLGPEKTRDLIGGLLRNGFCVAREDTGTFAFLRPREQRPSLTERREAPGLIPSGGASVR